MNNNKKTNLKKANIVLREIFKKAKKRIKKEKNDKNRNKI